MMNERTQTRLLPAGPEAIALGAVLLRAGRLVAFPTETVYGLGADALNPDAVADIFAAKGRPADNPLIMHIHSADQLDGLVRVPGAAGPLMERFWPGPLTLLMPRTDRVPDIVTAGLDTVAVRMPSHPVARDLLREAGVPRPRPTAAASRAPRRRSMSSATWTAAYR